MPTAADYVPAAAGFVAGMITGAFVVVRIVRAALGEVRRGMMRREPGDDT